MSQTNFNWVTENDVCFITGQIMDYRDNARWTGEFDAWVSEKGQQLIENAYRTGELENNREWEIIYGEWYAEDESRGAVMDELFRNVNDCDGDEYV
tara:strand:+ start:1916 stop:2203 length:288 start_codon:yes stop_codon:yes gene_type:complete